MTQTLNKKSHPKLRFPRRPKQLDEERGNEKEKRTSPKPKEKIKISRREFNDNDLMSSSACNRSIQPPEITIQPNRIFCEKGKRNLHLLPRHPTKRVKLERNRQEEKFSSLRAPVKPLNRFESQRVPLGQRKTYEFPTASLNREKEGEEEVQKSTSYGGNGRWGEVPNLYEFLFEIKPEQSSPGEVFKPIDEPTFIVLAKPAEESHACLKVVHDLCYRSLREFKGGEVKSDYPMQDRVEDEMAVKYVEEFDIMVLDEDSIREVENLKRGVKRSDLEKWIQKFSGLGLHYVIFEKEESEARQFYEKLRGIVGVRGRVFLLTPKDLGVNLKQEISSLAWGFLHSERGDYCKAFRNARRTYRKKLDIIRDHVEKNLKKYTRVTAAEESPRHNKMKHLIVKHLADKDEIERRNILVEDGPQLGRIPDVYDESRSIAIEVETLYGAGKFGGHPLSKIRDEVIGGYRERKTNKPSELWIVLETITAIRHLKGLARLENYCKNRKGQIGFPVKFFVPNLNEEGLVPLRDLVLKTKKLKTLCPPKMGTDRNGI